MIEQNSVLKIRNEKKDLNYYFNNFKAFAKVFQITQKEAQERIEAGSFRIKVGYRAGIWTISKAPRSAVEEQFYFEVLDYQPKRKTCLCGCGEEITRAGDDYLDSCYRRELTGTEEPLASSSVISTKEESYKVKY